MKNSDSLYRNTFDFPMPMNFNRYFDDLLGMGARQEKLDLLCRD